MENYQPASPRTDRKTVERNRRNHMKTLYSDLNSVIPNQNSKEAMPMPDQLEEATNYIKRLKNKLERLKERKEQLMGIERLSKSMSSSGMTTVELRKPPHIEIHDMGSALEVILISEFLSHFMFYEIIRVLQEEGADVVNANFYLLGQTYFHTIHSEVGESTFGSGAARISSRLKAYVHEFFNSL
ncbi:transcription factor bHLH162-like isoform X2 [Macadamia integrifolia]|uniref:transcription factor bHLH162-like isoform X2 n=1 Tax=Macadamia integrifolia TaxID=60698 RepID=UPI001C52E1ED|nr:transcription factor bHLH162-like isoform X2 [Macadamia integrifolia]